MPKVVDREARREEVCGAAMRILARSGPASLTLKSLAAELGGSITLVTYFFRSRDDLFEVIVDDLLSSYDEASELAITDDPYDDLHRLLVWMVPFNPTEDEREASRVALVSMRDSSPSINHFFVAMEDRLREVIARRLAPILDESVRPIGIDAVRSGVNGLVLSIVEHPARWPASTRLAVVDVIIAGVRSLAAR